MPDQTNDHLAEILEAAGHNEAAKLARAFANVQAPPAETPAETPPAPKTQQEAEQQLAQSMLDQINSLNGRNTTVLTSEGWL